MIDLRIWRAALLVVPLVLIVGMFSLEDVPNAQEPALPPDTFDGDAAASLARDLAEDTIAPKPGSDEDAALAETVLTRLREIPTAEISEQRFDASFEGEDVELRNLITVIPGQSDRQIALVVQRDSARTGGAASTLAATAAMLEIATGFTGATHTKTLVFVSTGGGSIGAEGARRFARTYSDAALLDAVVVLSRPAADQPVQPMVIPWSTGPQSTSAQLAETARQTVFDETGFQPGDQGPVDDFLRLALPAGLGEQAPLVEEGFDAIRLSSSGELPPSPDEDEVSDVSATNMSGFGRAALALMLAVDARPEPPEHGPNAYIGFAGNLLPGWALSALALALLLVAAAPAAVALSAAAHSPFAAARAIGWAALRAVPLLGALALVFAFSLVGVIDSPKFPFDPAVVSLDLGGKIAIGIALVALTALAFLLRPLLPPPERLAPIARPAALLLAALAGLGVWALNPYLALLVGIGLQAWVPAASDLSGRRWAAALLLALGLVPILLVVGDLAGRFDSGFGVVWDLMFMLTGGQLSWRLALLSALLLGAGLAIWAAAGGRTASSEDELSLSGLIARGRVIEQRRRARGEQGPRERRPRGRGRRGRAGRRDRRRERARPPSPDEVEPPAGPEPPQEPEPGAPEPPQSEPDPRMWSKPRSPRPRPV